MIKALGLTIYTNYRDFVCLDEDIPNLPHDVADGSTAITRDTQQEFVYCKKEDEWKEEKRPIPELAYRGEVKNIEQCYRNPAYGDMQLIRKTSTNVYMVYWNGIKWKNLEEEKEK